MITIFASTDSEYNKMMDVAQKYICTQLPFIICGKYPPHSCDKCFKDNHVKCGINVFRIVDDTDKDEL